MREKWKCPECGLVQWHDDETVAPCKRCGYSDVPAEADCEEPLPWGISAEPRRRFEAPPPEAKSLNAAQKTALASWLLPVAVAALGFFTHDRFPQGSENDVLLDRVVFGGFGLAILLALGAFFASRTYGTEGALGPAVFGAVLAGALLFHYTTYRRGLEPPPAEARAVTSQGSWVEVRMPPGWEIASSAQRAQLGKTDTALFVHHPIDAHSFSVFTELRPDDRNFVEYARRVRDGYKDRGFVQESGPEKFSLDGWPARQYVFNHTEKGMSYRAAFTFAETSRHFHLLIAQAEEARWNGIQGALDEMTRSVKLLNVTRRTPAEDPGE